MVTIFQIAEFIKSQILDLNIFSEKPITPESNNLVTTQPLPLGACAPNPSVQDNVSASVLLFVILGNYSFQCTLIFLCVFDVIFLFISNGCSS